MQFVLFDGSECIDFNGNYVKGDSLGKSDVALCTFSQFKSFPAANEAGVERYQESLAKQGRSTLVADTSLNLIAFSIDSSQHQNLRDQTRARIAECAYATAIACDVSDDETLVIAYRFGNYAYMNLWIEGEPLEEHFVIAANMNSRLEHYLETISNRAGSTKLRIVSNLLEEQMSWFLESSGNIVSGDDVDIKFVTRDINELAKDMLPVISVSEYVTQEELAARIRARTRKRKIVVFALATAISIPGIGFGVYNHWALNSLNNEITTLQQTNDRMYHDVKTMQEQKGGSLYYNQNEPIQKLALILVKHQFHEGSVYRENQSSVGFDAINNENVSGLLKNEPALSVDITSAFVKADSINFRIAGRIKESSNDVGY